MLVLDLRQDIGSGKRNRSFCACVPLIEGGLWLEVFLEKLVYNIISVRFAPGV